MRGNGRIGKEETEQRDEKGRKDCQGGGNGQKKTSLNGTV
jgi:hypothetical protein